MLINDLQREIDRLQGSSTHPVQTVLTGEDVGCAGGQSQAPTDVPLYAPPALGEWTPSHRVDTREIDLKVTHYFHVTNLGTLLDALA